MASNRTGLDLDDLKAIVKICVKNRVRSLKWQDFILDFGCGPAEENNPAPPPLPSQRKKPVKAITGEEQTAQTKLGLLEDELVLREQQIADLQLTNPLAAEEMIVNGELDDDTGDDTDNE